MKRASVRWIVLIAAVIMIVAACKKEGKELPEPSSVSYGFSAPSYFPAQVYTFQNNELVREGFELGRKLFYAPVLSRDSTISCGSCHQQFVAFAHSGHSLSHGIDDHLTTRNSIGLFNLAWQQEFFWDGGVVSLENVPLAPITNPLEMDEKLSKVVYKLNRNPKYKQAFKNVFHQDTINSQQVLRALAQFMGLMVSANSKYDVYKRGEGTLTSEELEGLQLVRQKCTPCHDGELFTDLSYRNNGLNATFPKDSGRAHITAISGDAGKFKVPSLRKIALTGPYMHNGKMNSLDEVIEHYRTGVKTSATLDAALTNNGLNGIVLTDPEKQRIITFLQTLTDYSFLTDLKFSDPFNQ